MEVLGVNGWFQSSHPSSPSLPERQAAGAFALVVAIIVILFGLAYLSIDTLSAARAYVGGEGLWSKAQKDATYYLVRYAGSGDPAAYEAFRQYLEVPLGDRVAREELERPRPDPARVRTGFLLGRNHPDDVNRMGTFFRRFRHLSFVDEAIGIWAAGDAVIGELSAAGSRIHDQVAGGHPDRAAIAVELNRVHRLSLRLTALEDAFSGTIGAGARWAAAVALALIGLTAMVLAAIAGAAQRRAVRRVRAAEAARQALEQQLLQAQKMEALGQLTGGIAHDFNNLLTVILATANLIEEKLPDAPAGPRADMVDLKRAARRGAEMIRKLMAFSRSSQTQLRPIAPAEVVRAAGGMLLRILPEHIAVEISVADAVPPILSDPASLEQVLLNLATNARDAMPGGGTLTIAVSTDPPRAGGPSWVVIEVRDTGSGMDPGTRDRMFEPFFTTKPPGQGTGLGSTMVYGIVKQHGGTIEVDSTLGRGTTVRLRFPAAPVGQLRRSGPQAAPDGAERALILLAEDETALRRAAARILEGKGYEVLAAGDGEEALALAREHRRRLSLLLTDVVMPKMGGPALYQALRDEGVEVPVLFMSGYAGTDMPGSSPVPEGAPFLPKPWDASELLQRIALVLRPAPGDEARP
jgi:signal transduction histidine kinase/ActR/RegA family two-component response regulator